MRLDSPPWKRCVVQAAICAWVAALCYSCGAPRDTSAETRAKESEPPPRTELVAPVPATTVESARSFLTVPEFQEAIRAANPGYTGRAVLVTDAAKRVVQANLSGCELRRLEPFADIALEVLDLSDNPLEDLTPLSGMPLQVLLLERTAVVDLTPLAGMKLERLSLADTPVEDLRPLMQAQIIHLDLRQTGVTDLTPLGVVPVEELRLDGTRVQSLAPLASCPLRILTLSRTPVRDLSPLQGRPLRVLDISGTGVTVVTPILGSQLQRLLFTRKRIRTGLDGLRAMRSLREIGDPPRGCKAAPDYWKDIDAE